MRFYNFNIHFTRHGDEYHVMVNSELAGQAHGVFRPPAIAMDFPKIAPQSIHRGVERDAIGPGQRLNELSVSTDGRALFETLFTSRVRERLRLNMDRARSKHAKLRIRLWMANVPELANLPWELLFDPELNHTFSLSNSTPVVRYLDALVGEQPLTIKPPIKVLVCIANPNDSQRLAVEQEWANLQLALKTLIQDGLVILDLLEQATYSKLLKQLRQAEYHIFHFIGHGDYDQKHKQGRVLFQNGRKISAGQLKNALCDHNSLRLVILNACHGAYTSPTNAFTGTAQTLTIGGIPSVIAMRHEITDDAAITFAKEFYRALADGYPIDVGLSEARKVMAEFDSIEWATPVLFMRTRDSNLFDSLTEDERNQLRKNAAELQRQEKLRQQLASTYQRAKEQYEQGNLDAAQVLLEEIKRQQPNYQGIQLLLERVHAVQVLIDRLSELIDQGAEMLAKQEWQHAKQVYEKVLSIAHDRIDQRAELRKILAKQIEVAQAELSSAIRHERISPWLREAHRYLESSQWAHAIGELNQVLNLVPGHDQATKLLLNAQEQLVQEKVRQKKKAREDQICRLKQAIDIAELSGNWSAAITAYEELLHIDPNQPGIDERLAKAHSMLDQQNTALDQQNTALDQQNTAPDPWIAQIEPYLRMVGGRLVAFISWAAPHFQEVLGRTSSLLQKRSYQMLFVVAALGAMLIVAFKIMVSPAPDASSVLFSSSRGIFLAPIGGGPTTRLTDEPAVMPSRNRYGQLMFTRSLSEAEEHIVVMDLETGEPHQITHGSTVNRAGSWSPDGKTIAFESNHATGNGNHDIYLMNPDGTNIRRLTYLPGWQGGPCWSPDGKRIVFQTLSSEGIFELMLIDVETEGYKKLVSLQGQHVTWPSWSPDNSMIVFMVQPRGGGTSQLYRVNSDGNELIMLEAGPGSNQWPRWSPDGAWIAFRSNRDGPERWRVYLYSLENQRVHPIDVPLPGEIFPGW